MPAHELRALAVDSLADPRTVRRALAGFRVAPMTLERIRRALRLRGKVNGADHLLAQLEGVEPRERAAADLAEAEDLLSRRGMP